MIRSGEGLVSSKGKTIVIVVTTMAIVLFLGGLLIVFGRQPSLTGGPVTTNRLPDGPRKGSHEGNSPETITPDSPVRALPMFNLTQSGETDASVESGEEPWRKRWSDGLGHQETFALQRAEEIKEATRKMGVPTEVTSKLLYLNDQYRKLQTQLDAAPVSSKEDFEREMARRWNANLALGVAEAKALGGEEAWVTYRRLMRAFAEGDIDHVTANGLPQGATRRPRDGVEEIRTHTKVTTPVSHEFDSYFE